MVIIRTIMLVPSWLVREEQKEREENREIYLFYLAKILVFILLYWVQNKNSSIGSYLCSIGKHGHDNLSVLRLDELRPNWGWGKGRELRSKTGIRYLSYNSPAGRFGYFLLNERVRPNIWLINRVASFSK